MDKPVIDEAAIRAYLLGRIGPEEEMSIQIDEHMLVDPEFSLLIDVIEDEILEDYVDGVLTPAEVEAVESHFLTPPERQRKLRRICLISRRIAHFAADENTPRAEVRLRVGTPSRRHVLIFPSARTWGEIAVGLALVFCSIYFWNQQRRMQLAVEQSRQELAMSRRDNSKPNTPTQGAVVALNLVVPGLNRGGQELPEVHLPPGTTTLRLAVALSAEIQGPLSVRLQQEGKMLWSRDSVTARPVAGGAMFAVDIPSPLVPEGTCRLIVSTQSKGGTSYWFKVTKTG